jgi:hypothetical protein
MTTPVDDRTGCDERRTAVVDAQQSFGRSAMFTLQLQPILLLVIYNMLKEV